MTPTYLMVGSEFAAARELVNLVTPKELLYPCCLCTVGHTDQRQPRRWEAGQFLLLQVAEGKGTVQVGKQVFSLSGGEVLFCPSEGEVSLAPAAAGRWRIRYLTFLCPDPFGSLPRASTVVRYRDADAFRNACVNLIRRRNREDFKEYGSITLYGLLLQMLPVGGGGSDADGGFVQSNLAGKIVKTASEMAKRSGDSFTLTALADSCGVSKAYYCRRFKELTGLRPIAYLNRLRLHRAAELLLALPNHSVSEIAKKVGYDSHTYFGKIFRTYTGVSPTEYRADPDRAGRLFAGPA